MDKVSVGIIIAMIIGFSVVGVMDIDPTHYCEERQIKAFCDTLSSTMKTCYTLADKVGGKRCSSTWKEIPTVFDEVENPIINITNPTGYSGAVGRQYLCPPAVEGECEVIN